MRNHFTFNIHKYNVRHFSVMWDERSEKDLWKFIDSRIGSEHARTI